MSWKNLLESISEWANDHIRLRNEYLAAENAIFRNQIDGRVQLTDSERQELAEIGAKLGKKALEEIATIAQPDTILAWNRKFANAKVDPSELPKTVGHPRVDQEIEDQVLRMARENRSWGYDRIQGVLKHLGYTISDQTVGNILKRHGISPAPERKKTVTWHEFIRSHRDVLVMTGFFNSEMWSWFGLAISYLLSFIYFGRHQVQSMGMTLHQPMQAMQALMQRFLNFSLNLRRWWHLNVHRLPQGGVRDTVQGPMGSEVAFAEARTLRSPNLAKEVILSSARHRRIRDGPKYQQPQHDRQCKDGSREAA